MILLNLHAIKIAFVLLCASLLLGACNSISKEEKTPMTINVPEHYSELAWLETADAKQDATVAIEQKDYRLLVAAGRGERTPGIDAEIRDDLKQRCGVQLIKGSTDVFKDTEHRVLLKEALKYAAEYNKLMAQHCQ